jgi:hypothetical protein
VKGTLSRHSLWDKHNFGGYGFVGFCILSFLALIVASVTGQRSMKTKAKTINSLSDFLGMRAVPGKGYWIAICLAEFLMLWIGLACVATALNFRFRERNEYFPCKTSDSTATDSGIKTRNRLQISAPFMTAPDTRDIEKAETVEAVVKETENDMHPVEQEHQQSISSGPHHANIQSPPSEEVTVVVKEIEETDVNASNDQTMDSVGHDHAKEKAEESIEAGETNDESEVGSGVPLSSAPKHNHVEDVVGEGQETDFEAGEEVNGAKNRNVEERQEEEVEGYDQSQYGAEPAVQRHKRSSEEQTIVNDRWSCQAEASPSRRTTLSRWPAVSAVEKVKKTDTDISQESSFRSHSDGYDAADESSRGPTPSDGLESLYDGFGCKKYRMRQGGHVFEMLNEADDSGRRAIPSDGSEFLHDGSRGRKNRTHQEGHVSEIVKRLSKNLE